LHEQFIQMQHKHSRVVEDKVNQFFLSWLLETNWKQYKLQDGESVLGLAQHDQGARRSQGYAWGTVTKKTLNTSLILFRQRKGLQYDQDLSQF
jgi:hypothetical protein